MLFRRTPSTDVLSLRNAIDRLFEDSFPQRPWFETDNATTRTIPLDIYEKGDKVIVKATVPGIKAGDLSVRIRDDVLTISGDTQEDKEQKHKNFYVHERRHGHIERSIVLPSAVISDQAKADFEDGTLTLTLQKTAGASAKKIAVRTK